MNLELNGSRGELRFTDVVFTLAAALRPLDEQLTVRRDHLVRAHRLRVWQRKSLRHRCYCNPVLTYSSTQKRLKSKVLNLPSKQGLTKNKLNSLIQSQGNKIVMVTTSTSSTSIRLKLQPVNIRRVFNIDSLPIQTGLTQIGPLQHSNIHYSFHFGPARPTSFT